MSGTYRILRSVCGHVVTAVRRSERSVTFCAIFMLAIASGSALAQSFPGASPGSSHSLDYCYITGTAVGGSCPQQTVPGPPIDLIATLLQACSNFAQCQSTLTNDTWAWVGQCSPNVPIPAGSAGGPWAGFSVSGTFGDPDGTPDETITSTGWGMGSCGCTDGRNQNNVGVGTDGTCYCKLNPYDGTPSDWDAGLHTCAANHSVRGWMMP